MNPHQCKRAGQRFMLYHLGVTSKSNLSHPAADAVTMATPLARKEEQNSAIPASMDGKPGCSKLVVLPISAEDSGIHTMPLITLEAVWSKATALLQREKSISPAPGAD